MKKYKIGYTTGVFDMFHIGHLNIIKRAKEQCEYLVVGVTTDELCEKRKNKRPIICQEDRVAIVESIKYVDRVVLQNDMDKVKAVQQYNVDAVFVGSDWKGNERWIKTEKIMNNYGVDVVFLPYTQGTSSTILTEALYKLINR